MALAALSLLACARALHEPRPLTPPGGPGEPAAGDAAQLLEEADASWARRPDIAAVRQAEAAYLDAARADERGTAGLYGAIRAKAWLAEHEPDSQARSGLASSAVDLGQLCEQRAPSDPVCAYGLALALGLQARENRATAVDGLKLMVERLRRAAAADPRLDEAGPERVLALVLLRAPAWPVGPGDKETALAEARKAVALAPDHPPNQTALSEALAGNGEKEEARAAAERAVALARARVAAGDPDAPDWLKSAQQALDHPG